MSVCPCHLWCVCHQSFSSLGHFFAEIFQPMLGLTYANKTYQNETNGKNGFKEEIKKIKETGKKKNEEREREKRMKEKNLYLKDNGIKTKNKNSKNEEKLEKNS